MRVVPPPAALPTVAAINNNARFVVNSEDPTIILFADITLPRPAKLAISGVIMGTFYYVCGIAIYINGVPISLGTGNNASHPDCCQIHFGMGHNSRLFAEPYCTISPLLEAGTHKVEIGVISKWGNSTRDMYINNRQQGDMASSSHLKVEAF